MISLHFTWPRTLQNSLTRAIGQLKRRFHCLHGELRMAPDRCCGIVVACCILHNFAKQMGMPDEEQDEPDTHDESDEHVVSQGPGDGVYVRNMIVQRHFS